MLFLVLGIFLINSSLIEFKCECLMYEFQNMLPIDYFTEIVEF